MKRLFKLFSIIIVISASNSYSFAAEKVEYLKTDWSFKGLFGKFDRASLKEVIKFILKYVLHVIQ